MFELTYHFKSPYFRAVVNLIDYKEDLKCAVQCFPMVELKQVTPHSFRIIVNTDSPEKKNFVVKKLMEQIAFTSLKVFVVHRFYQTELFTVKTTDIPKAQNQSSYIVYTMNWEKTTKMNTQIKSFLDKEDLTRYLTEFIKTHLDDAYDFSGLCDCFPVIEKQGLDLQKDSDKVAQCLIDCIFAYIEDEFVKPEKVSSYHFYLYAKNYKWGNPVRISVGIIKGKKKDINLDTTDDELMNRVVKLHSN